VTELAGTQLSSLLETLPGIATVLRSPVADAMVNLIKAGSGQAAFSLADADELLKYAIRRNLISADESERVLAETREFLAGVPRPVAKVESKPRKPVPVKAAVPAKKAVKPLKLSKAIPTKKKAAKPGRTTAKAGRPAHKKK
jgi:hypothetical protein